MRRSLVFLAAMLTRKLRDLVFPEGIVFLVAFALVHWGAALPSAALAVRVYPVVVLGAGALLAWRFRRGRLGLALAALVLADAALRWLAPLDIEASTRYAGPPVVRTIAILLPLTLAMLAFVDERGLLTPSGLRRIWALTGQTVAVLAVWLLSGLYPRPTAHVFDLALLPASTLAWLPLGQPAALVALAAIGALVGRALWRGDAESRGLLWAAVGCVIATSAGPAGGRATLHLANAGLVLVVAAVESAYALAYHDELTGLPGRRAFNEALLRVADRYTVAVVDVDHFKKFNDTHGHDVGDQVLRMVATRLGGVGGGGRAFRYGGEEFVVLFPGKSVEESAPHLEALRASVADATFTLRGPGRPKRKPKTPRAARGAVRRLAVTVSIGAAEARAGAVPDAVVKAADQALYRAKEGGRNRVEC